VRRLRRLPITTVHWYLKRRYGSGEVPWRLLANLRRLATDEDALCPETSRITSSGEALNNRFLSWHFADSELGLWSLTAEALNFLEAQIQALRPALILEFGSGISTVCLARYMTEIRGRADIPHVVSIEQSPEHAAATEQLLSVAGLSGCARVAVRPVTDCAIERQQTRCYDLSESIISILDGRRADFVVIDGPADVEGCRFGTLPLIREYVLSDARFFLDDALRDGELRVAALWDALPYLRIDGIHLVGKGLLSGVCTNV